MRYLYIGIFLSIIFAGGISFSASAQTAAPAAGPGMLKDTGVVPLQGDCNINALESKAHEGMSANFSTWTCTGQSNAPLYLEFSSGLKESCLYIDNISSEKKAFFVPLRTDVEWLAFKKSTKPGDTLSGKVAITYGCNADTVQKDACGASINLPVARDGETVTVATAAPFDLKTTYICEASDGCGAWIKTAEAGSCGKKGVCGSSNGLELYSAPSDGLCAEGEPTAVTGSGPWAWSCKGNQGASTATCGAKLAPCNPNNKPIDLVIVLDASGSMQPLVDAAKNAIQTISTSYLADKPNVSVTLTVFGGKGYSADSAHSEDTCAMGKLLGPVTLDSSGVGTSLNNVQAVNNTPFAKAIEYSNQFVNGKPHPAMIVLTDGYETCGGDVNASVQALNKKTKLFGVAYSSPTYGSYNADSFSGFDSYAPAETQQQVIDALNAYMTQSICQTGP